MTTDESPSAQREALSTGQMEAAVHKVEAVERQVAALEAALSASRKTGRWLLLGFLVFLCVFLFLFYQLAKDFQKKENLQELANRSQQRLVDSTLPRLRRQTLSLVDTARPVLTKAFMEQAHKDAPRYASALKGEGDVLVENLKQRIQERLNEHYRKVLEEHRAVLKEEYPDLTDEQLGQLADNIQKAAEQLVQKYYVDRLNSELQDLFDLWEQMPVADPVGPDDLPLEQQLIGTLLEVVKLRLANPESEFLGIETTH